MLENQITSYPDDALPTNNSSRKLTVTQYLNKTNVKPSHEYQMSWGELKELLKKRDVRENKDGPAFSGVRLKSESTRASENVESIDLIVADIDTKYKTTGGIIEVLKPAPPLEKIEGKFNEYDYLAYTSHSHDPQNGIINYRIAFPLSRTVSPKEYPQVWAGFNNLIGGYCDPATKDPSRIFYLASCPKSTAEEAWWTSNHGQWLDPEFLIANAPQPKAPVLHIVKNKNELPETEKNIEEVKLMLLKVPANCPREVWLQIIWALASTGWACAKELAREWSMTCSELFNESDFERDWGSFKADRSSSISFGTLKHHATLNGWEEAPHEVDPLSFLQDKYALLLLGGKIGFVDRHIKNAVKDSGEAKPLEVVNKPDGKLLLTRLLSETFPQADVKKVTDKFLIDTKTKMYLGVEFHPKRTSEEMLNLWVDYTIQPKNGNWGLIREFLLLIICSGSDKDFDYLIKYIAHALQKPEIKPGVMIIMLGGQGIGKGTLARILRKIWRKTYLQVGRVDEIVGTFNAPLERSYIVFLDEAVFDYKSTNCLKSLVTEPTILINQKNQPARQIDSFHRFFSSTNAERYKTTDRDDRRDFVLRVSEAKKNDLNYWSALNHEIDSGGVEAFVDYLLKLDLTDFNVRAKPNTKELTEQKLQSLDKFHRWWFQCLSRGHILIGSDNTWPEFISTADLLSHFKYEFQPRGQDLPTNRDIKKLISNLCLTAEPMQKNDESGRKRGYALPPLSDARNDFEKYIGDSIEWED